MIYRLLSLIVLCTVTLMLYPGADSPSQPSNAIVWQEGHSLAWSDFEGRAQKNSPHDALSNCGLAMSMEMSNGIMHIKVEAVFNPSKSWVRSDSPTDKLLAHEQLHFDIYERYARELRKRLSERSWSIDEDLAKIVQDEYAAVDALIGQAQHDYDKETEHSLDIEQQKRWNQKVANELDSLKDFDEVEVKVLLN